MIRIFVSRLVLPDKLWSIGLFIEFVDDEGLRRPVAWTFCSTADASVAFRLPFVTPDFPLSALKAPRRSLWHRQATCGVRLYRRLCLEAWRLGGFDSAAGYLMQSPNDDMSSLKSQRLSEEERVEYARAQPLDVTRAKKRPVSNGGQWSPKRRAFVGLQML